MKRVAVIGAGITGITTAYELYSRGYDVTVIEALEGPSMFTSFANGGQLSACNAEVWTNPGTIWKGIKYLIKPNAPLLINPKPSLHKISWFARFISNIPNYESNTKATVELAIAGRERMVEIGEKEGISYDRLDKGILHVYRTIKSLKQGHKVSEILKKGGLDRENVTVAEIQKLEPALNTDGVIGGIYTPSDSTGDIYKFTTGLAKALKKKGVKFLYSTKVNNIVRYDDGEIELALDNETSSINPIYDKVVICAGVYSQGLAQSLGDTNIHIYPVKGYSLTFDLTSGGKHPKVSILDEEAKIVTSRLGSRLRVAGTAEFNGYNQDINSVRSKPLLDWAERNFEKLNYREVHPWIGLRPMSPSMMPYVCKSKTPGIYYNTGHGHLGWTLGVSTATMLAELVQNDN